MSVPQVLLAGRYRLITVIAAGGMGVVWEAWDERLERRVAIKQLRVQPGVSEVEAELAKNRAMREARITARLHHPNAVPVLDSVEHDGQPCLIMPFLPSTPLSTVLRERGALPLREAVRIGAQIASALAAAHGLRIVHRDVKPGNILITADGAAHISDFGISHAMGDATLTRTGMVYGTPAYLAPEMAQGGDATFASDVFSLGSTLYAAVEGGPPFGSEPNLIALLHKVAAGRVPRPARAGVLTPFLIDMLAPEPEARPTMDAVASLLAELKTDTEPVEQTPPVLAPYVTTEDRTSGSPGADDRTTQPWGPAAGKDGASPPEPVAAERTSALPWRSALRYGAAPAVVAQAAAAPSSAAAELQDFGWEPEGEGVDEAGWDDVSEPEFSAPPLGPTAAAAETPPPAWVSRRRGTVAAAIAALAMLVAATLSGRFNDDSPGTAGQTGAAPAPSSTARELDPSPSPPERPAPPGQAGPPGSGGPGAVELTELGRYTAEGAEFDESGAEIVAYDATTERLFVTNGSEGTLDAVDLADPSTPELVEQVRLEEYGAGINGVGAQDGLVGVAVSPEDEQGSRGRAVFLDPATLEVVADVEVGFLPDALLFSPDGGTAVVANEGEPSDDYQTDPIGTISVIDTATFEVTEVGFAGLDVSDVVNEESFRTFGPSAGDLAVDIEPENVTFDADGSTAYVTLLENNAIAKIDLGSGELRGVFALGFKDWSADGPDAGNGLDASNEDDAIRIRDWPVLGIPHPDALAAYQAGGETFLVTANEGDARDYDGYSEKARLGEVGFCDRELSYDGMSAEELEQEENLGRLNITTTNGYDEDGDCLDQAYAYGARSFSIYTPEGELVYDSGSDFEDVTAELLGRDGFNADNVESGADAFDSRSDDMGPEPEGLAVGEAYGNTYAFVGLERVGGLMTYRVTDPSAPEFVSYTTGRAFAAATPEESVDLEPEGVLFITDEDSPTGWPLVVVSHEVTGTTTIYQVDAADQVDMPSGGVAARGGGPLVAPTIE